MKDAVPQNKVPPEAIQQVARAYDELARGAAGPASSAK